MPLYEYECTECHRRTEKIQKFSDPELTTCPHCGGPLHRTLTAPAVQFKGSGWYKDLYSSAKPASAGSGESTPASGNGAEAPAAGKSGAAAAPASTPSTSAPAVAGSTTSSSSGS